MLLLYKVLIFKIFKIFTKNTKGFKALTLIFRTFDSNLRTKIDIKSSRHIKIRV